MLDLQNQLGLAKQQAFHAAEACLKATRDAQESQMLRQLEQSSSATTARELQDAVAVAIRDKER